MTIRSLAAISVLVAATTVSAQQYKSLVSVATFKVPPGREDAFIEKGKAFVPVLDKLMESGVVLAYGIDASILHVPDENNVDFWVVVPNYAALEKSDAAIDEFMSQHPEAIQEVAAMSDMSAHHDLIIQTWDSNYAKVPVGGKPVMSFDTVRIKSGKMDDFMTLFQKYDKPVLDKLVAESAIYGYEVDTEAMHTMAPGMVWVLAMMPDLATEDKVEGAFDAAMKNLPEGDRKIADKLFLDVVEPGSHRDRVARTVVFRTK